MEKLVNIQLSNGAINKSNAQPRGGPARTCKGLPPWGRNGRMEARLRYWYSFFLISFISINKPPLSFFKVPLLKSLI